MNKITTTIIIIITTTIIIIIIKSHKHGMELEWEANILLPLLPPQRTQKSMLS
jgi:hypothetical protein